MQQAEEVKAMDERVLMQLKNVKASNRARFQKYKKDKGFTSDTALAYLMDLVEKVDGKN